MIHTPKNEHELNELISEPSVQLIEFFKTLSGDISILGANGKIGLSLALMAKKAIKASNVARKLYAVSRFSTPEGRKLLDDYGIDTISCDLNNREEVEKLPKTKNVIFMAGRKFGTEGSEAYTWAMNVLMPAICAEHFKDSRIVVYSTGCVYSLVSHTTGGSVETDAPNPIGEYSQSCLGRERVFEYFSLENKTPILLYRLNYSTDLRYGVLCDLAKKIWNDEPISTDCSHFNILWQGDANNYSLLSLSSCSSPATPLNITGQETLSIVDGANEMAAIMGKKAIFSNKGIDKSYLNNAQKSFDLFGKPSVSAKELIRMQAEWTMRGGRDLNKPTHFEVGDGKF